NNLDFFIYKNNLAQFQADRSNKFDYTENVNALYISYQTPIKTAFNVQAGLRLEQTNSRGILTRSDNILQADNDIKREYIDIFPSFSISWDLNKKNALGLSYSKRIDRPNYQDLNPFENKLDELTYEKGNAFLKPQYTDNIELSHTYSNKITTTVGYSYIKDFATQVTDTVRNATFVQNQNIASLKMITFNIGTPTQITKWLSGYVNCWFNYNMFSGKISDKDVSLDFTSLGAYLQQSVSLGKDYKAEISGWYNGPQINLGTWEFKSQASIDLGLQKQVLKNKGTIKLSFTDIFRTAPWNATSNFGGLKIKADGYWESHTFKINFSYRFGNNQVKKVRERKTGLDSESKRIKN
ncbi:MAG: outer membrane beta-barrel family protein, partial [Sediminibacterium sp.]|nr:outer membrane beta-barrel family protein [Sediminibacterium sp.]